MMNKSQLYQLRPSKEFFENEGFVSTLDAMAQRYKVLPTDLLELSLYEFSLNVAIMVKAVDIETKAAKREPNKPKADWKSMGFSYEVKQ